MKKLDKYMIKTEYILFCILLTVMTVVVFLQVIFRYVLRSSLPWSEELSRDCLIFVTFIGVSAGLKAGTHTSIDFLVTVLPPKTEYWVRAIGHVITLVLSVAFFVTSADLTLKIFGSGQWTQALRIPTWISYSALPIGFAGGVIRSIQNLINHLRGIKENVSPVEIYE